MKIYIPLFYSEKVKRPDKKYFLNNIIGEDFLILLLSFAYSSSHPFLSALGLFLLQMSFWCIYELGYIENDLVGEKFEDKAILSYTYKSGEISFGFWQPWLWSLGLSTLGILTLAQEQLAAKLPLNFLAHQYSIDLSWVSRELTYWMVFLVALRVLFYIYNYINKQSRVWLYFLLQAFRYCGFLILLSANMAGLILLLSSILVRSIQYTLYRYLGGKSGSWPMDFPRYFFCLLIYLIILGAISANARDVTVILNPQVLLISAFCLLRGCKHFYRVCSQFLPVSEDGSSQIS